MSDAVPPSTRRASILRTTPQPQTWVFVNYRREDLKPAVWQLYEFLSSQFGEDRVFFDNESIPAGAEYPEHLDQCLRDCAVLIVVIGQHWLDAQWNDGPLRGTRRLDDPDDWVRREIRTGIELGKIVIPVLITPAEMPPQERLPDDIRELVRRQAITLRFGPDLSHDLGRLASEVANYLERLGIAIWRSDERRIIEDYLDQLHGELTANGAISRYVRPSFRAENAAAHKALVEWRDKGNDTPDLLRLVEDASVLLLVGTGGAGKTTALCDLAKQYHEKCLEALRRHHKDDVVIPVYIDLGRNRGADPTNHESILDSLAPDIWRDSRFREYNWRFLLDGYNEVLHSRDRDLILGDIARLVEGQGDTKVVLTTRPRQTVDIGGPVYRINEISPGDADEFLAKIGAARQLIRAVHFLRDRDQAFHTLAGNAFVLCCLCRSPNIAKKYTKSDSPLYGFRLFDDITKAIVDERSGLRSADNRDRAHRALTSIATAMSERRDLSSLTIDSTSLEIVVNLGEDADWIMQACVRAGLLVSYHDDVGVLRYEFSHPRFQEYYTARTLVERLYCEHDKARTLIRTVRWHMDECGHWESLAMAIAALCGRILEKNKPVDAYLALLRWIQRVEPHLAAATIAALPSDERVNEDHEHIRCRLISRFDTKLRRSMLLAPSAYPLLVGLAFAAPLALAAGPLGRFPIELGALVAGVVALGVWPLYDWSLALFVRNMDSRALDNMVLQDLDSLDTVDRRSGILFRLDAYYSPWITERMRTWLCGDPTQNIFEHWDRLDDRQRCASARELGGNCCNRNVDILRRLAEHPINTDPVTSEIIRALGSLARRGVRDKRIHDMCIEALEGINGKNPRFSNLVDDQIERAQNVMRRRGPRWAATIGIAIVIAVVVTALIGLGLFALI